MADSSVTFKDASGATQTHDARTNAAGTEVRPTLTLGNDGDLVAGVDPSGALQVHAGVATLFYDSWAGPLDTADKWTVTGTAPTLSGGNMTMPATVSTYNALRTKDVVRANVGSTYMANGMVVEAATATGAGRFWGLGTPATVPAAAVLVQDGIGFEIDQATGALLAVTYAAGVRTTVATLTRPTDGAAHRYAMYFRVTAATWFIDNTQVPVASAAFPNVAVVELPAIVVRQNAASFTGTPVLTSLAHITGDTSRQGMTLIDPVIGTRQARVTPGGALLTAPTPAPTGTITSVALAITSFTVLAANTLRRSAVVYNDSSNVVYLACAATASLTAFTVPVQPGGYYELPGTTMVYTGIITAISAVASGNLRITEFT